MCRFSKTKKSSPDQTRRAKGNGLTALNVGLLVLCVLSMGAYAVLSISNTTQELKASKLEQTVNDQLVNNNSLSISISQKQEALLTPEKLTELGLVNVGTLEYAKSQGSAVALR